MDKSLSLFDKQIKPKHAPCCTLKGQEESMDLPFGLKCSEWGHIKES